MKKIVLLVSGLLLLAGCSAPEVKEAVIVYPSVQELDDIESGLASDNNWHPSVICWVGNDSSVTSKFKINTPGIVSRRKKKDAIESLDDMVSHAVSDAGLGLVSYTDDKYLTRSERLSIEKQIVVKSLGVEQTKVKEGECYDVKMVVEVVDYPNLNSINECVVPCRVVVPEGEEVNLEELCEKCSQNITKVIEFRNAVGS